MLCSAPALGWWWTVLPAAPLQSSFGSQNFCSPLQKFALAHSAKHQCAAVLQDVCSESYSSAWTAILCIAFLQLANIVLFCPSLLLCAFHCNVQCEASGKKRLSRLSSMALCKDITACQRLGYNSRNLSIQDFLCDTQDFLYGRVKAAIFSHWSRAKGKGKREAWP